MTSIDQPTRNLVPPQAVPLVSGVSSWTLAGAAFGEMRALFIPVYKEIWGWILVLQLIQLAASQLTSFKMDSLKNSGREDLLGIAVIAIFELIFTLVWSAFWVLLLSRTASRIAGVATDSQASRLSLATIVNRLLLEQTRVLAGILWRVPLIVPAGIQWVRLSMVPFVVLFDTEYQSGRRDALERSRALSFRHFWLLNWYLTFASIIGWVVDFCVQGDNQWILQTPVPVLMSAGINMLIQVAAALFLYSLYRLFAGLLVAAEGAMTRADV